MDPFEMMQSMQPRPPVPGEIWNFTEEERHCFAMELERLAGFLNEDAVAASHWIAAIRNHFEGGTKTTTTQELFDFAEAHVAAARRHLVSLMPENPETLRAIRNSEQVLDEWRPQFDRRIADAEEGVVRLPCDHTADEHHRTILAWYTRNIEQALLPTLIRVWRLPPEETITGKPFLARYDMERIIDEQAKQASESFGALADAETRDQLIMDMGMAPDDAEAMLARMRENREREHREQLVMLYEKNYRILD